ncbi:MAG: 2OG-Fe(II) oxygenase [Tatlockia sp.]|nr:2OG-Fe(II) oxygenase [Tatlockia sp.]
MTDITEEIYSKGYHIIDNFLDSSSFAKLRARAEQIHSKGYFKDAKIGNLSSKNQQPAIRNDRIFWLDEQTDDEAQTLYFQKIRALAKSLNQSLFLGLIDFESHFSIYNPGSFYKMHVDQFKTAQDRKISCVYYLNQNWQESFAGHLKLYNKDKELLAKVLPEANRFICFNSELPHEVCTTFATRYSIAGWMKTRSEHSFSYFNI